MYVEPHDLEHEFPHLRQTLDSLRASSERFARLAAEYDEVNLKVVSLEENDVPVDDFTIEELKKRRLKLKDQIYAMLRTHGISSH